MCSEMFISVLMAVYLKIFITDLITVLEDVRQRFNYWKMFTYVLINVYLKMFINVLMAVYLEDIHHRLNYPVL